MAEREFRCGDSTSGTSRRALLRGLTVAPVVASAIVSPYWKWGYPHLIGDPPMDDGGFTPDRVRPLVRALLDRVADVTGHQREALS